MNLRSSTFPALPALSLIGLLLILASPGFACGPERTVPSDIEALTSLEIQTPLLVFDAKGRLRRKDLRTGEWTDISNHGFKGTPTVKQSPEGRWISYGGTLRDRAVEQYWLFDKVTGSDRLFREMPPTPGIPEFSPDGRSIILVARREGQGPQPLDIESFDTESAVKTVLGTPGVLAHPDKDPWGSVEWSADGRELLVFAREMRTQIREHFAYRLPAGPFESIDGGIDNGRLLFFRKDKPIATYEAPTIPGHVRHAELSSPDGRWHAKVNATYELMVSTFGGSSRLVSKGEYDMCEGVTIGINGWMDARHMVYSVSHTTYVFDAETGKKALLFPEGDAPHAFTW